MKENITNIIGRVSKWLTLVVAVILISHSARAVTVFDNTQTRQTDGGSPLFFGQSGYEFGDEVVLSPAANAYLTNFTLEYFGTNLSGATMTLRIYANNGALYGTNFSAPGDLLYDSGAFAISDGMVDGFGSLSFNQDNSGFAIPVSSNFTWTVQFDNVGAGSAGLALYDPLNVPTVGADYAQYWELSGENNSWVYRNATPESGLTSVNFGAVAEAEALAADILPPALVISSPVDKYRTNAGSIVVNGTAKDAGGVALVLYNLNSGGYRPATFTGSALGNTNWEASLNLLVGANTFKAKAIDRSGNVKESKQLAYTFVVTNALTINFSEGAGSGATKGIVTMLNQASASTNLEIGKTYALQVIPTKAGVPLVNTFWYSNTIAISDSSTNLIVADKFTFTMETNLVLTLNCVTNRFIAAAGIYNGLVVVDGVDQQNSGFITIKADAKNKFSGKMSLAGDKLPVSGQFDLAGNANTITPKKITAGTSKIVISKKQALTNSVRVTMNFDGTIEGTVTNEITGVGASFIAYKNVWTPSSPATNYSGRYTMAIPPEYSDASHPSGYGVATVVIDTNGVVSMGGYSADGQKIKQKVTLSEGGYWPLFAANSVDVNANKLLKGSLLGWLEVQPNTNGDPDRMFGELKWIRTSLPTAIYYPSGFTNVSQPLVNKYAMTTGNDGKANARVLELASGEGFLKLTGGGLTAATNLAMTSSAIKGAMTVNILGADKKPPYEAKIGTKPFYGNVDGSFLYFDNTSLKTKFYGIALQDINKAYGFFLDLNGSNQAGKMVIEADQ